MRKANKKVKKEEVNSANVTPVTKKEYEPVTIKDDVDELDVKIDAVLASDTDRKMESSIRVEIPRKVYYQLRSYAKLIDEEITGLGYVEKINAHTFRITEAYLLKQIVSSARCEIDVGDQCALMDRLDKEGKDIRKLKCWWHSHNSMGAFWSQQDKLTSSDSVCDYYISLVITHKGEMQCKVGIYQPIFIEIDGVKVIMTDDEPILEIMSKCMDEIKDKVSTEKKAPIVVNNYANNYADYYGNRHNYGHLVRGGVQQDRELFPSKETAKETKQETIKDGLNANDIENVFGETFTMGGMTFRWNNEVQMYDVFSGGRTLTLDEIEANGIMDLADPLSKCPDIRNVN